MPRSASEEQYIHTYIHTYIHGSSHKLLKPGAREDGLVRIPRADIVQNFVNKLGPSGSPSRIHSLLAIFRSTLDLTEKLYGNRQFLAWLLPCGASGGWCYFTEEPTGQNELGET